MKVLVFHDYRSLSREAARRIAALLIQKPNAVLALPTGETPLGLYEQLVRLSQEHLLDFSKATIFILDEFLGIPKEHTCSFHRYMEEHLLSFVTVNKFCAPNPQPQDANEECERYERLIIESGGLDLAVLGLGINGHIAFNEPGTCFESRTHVATLTHETRMRLSRQFGGLERTPSHAITMGIKTIMNARSILLLVSGKEKKATLHKCLYGPISKELPASVLQLHPNLTVLADQDAVKENSNEL